jgi:biopolymer transport protein ExbD
MRRIRRSSMDEPRLEIMPLIDVIFLLLTFFVFALTLMVRAEVLDIRLPAIGAGQAPERAGLITVAVDDAGAVFVNGEGATTDTLVERIRLLQEQAEARGETVRIVVAADQEGRSGDLLAVLDLLASGGIGDVSVLGRPKDQ